MKRSLILILLSLFFAADSWAVTHETTIGTGSPVFQENPEQKFRQFIPFIAESFIGIPYRFGGNPQVTGTSDNSYLFYSIYTMAAREAGLTYHGYLPMKALLERVSKVSRDQVRNGDLLVLNNNLAAMVYKVERSGKLHFIYTSKKRGQVFSFNTDNVVFQVYWLENLKGFYRLSRTMLSPAK